MTDIILARAIHVLAIAHWIGGVSMVTIVILPALKHFRDPAERIALFERIESGFSFQAKISVVLAGISGFYLTHRLAAWDRFLSPDHWWMHAMVILWVIFMLILFVAEPGFLHRWFHERAATRPDSTFRLVQVLHWLMLVAGGITLAAAVLGAHGLLG